MRHCPLCHTENRPVANFCKHCGAVLATHCPRCGVELPEAALFCDHCGVRLLAPAEGVWESGRDGKESQIQVGARQATQMDDPQPQVPAVGSSASQPSTKRTTLQQFVPPELMARLEAATQRGGMVGERRIVTILFCDTVGSTAAAEQLDPEEWTEIINGAFEQMIGPIYHYEGTVARLMGDGLLAFFGAPIAHEDDPQRAVRAGLEIIEAVSAYAQTVQARWGLPLNVRVGINTGKVVVGSVGSDLRMEYTAIGDAINVAARMEQTAVPGTVQVAQETYRFVEPFFECEPLGPVELKGKETPLQAYRVLRARSQPARRRGPAGLQAPLLGREDELARLRQAAERAAQGVGQIALLVGEAGLGKSRLLEELHREQAGAGAGLVPLRWVQATGAAHEAAEPFALLRGLLRGLVGAASGAAPDELQVGLLALTGEANREELAAVLDVLLGVEGRGLTADALRAAADVPGPSLSGEGFRRRLAGAITTLLEDVARDGPLVLALDDLHWADAASVDLLLQLLPLAGALPLFFLFAMRPERQAPGWQLRQEAEATQAHRVTIINVRPLAPEDSERLVASLLSDGRLPAQVRQLVLQKAEGNPFFVEEVIRSLLDRGLVEAAGDGLRWRGDGTAEDIAIPDSLQSLLTARIDRLREETRYTLQLASVIGRSFTYRVLQHVSDLGETLPAQLEDLQRRTVIQESARLPELEYAFRHALMQEAAYRSILLRQRRAFHLRVAQAMEQLFADRLEAFALPLARHFFEAGDPRALGYFRLAGDAAMRVFANVEAAEHYGLAIRCAREQPESDAAETNLLTLYQRRGRALELTSRYEEALRNYQDLMALSQERESQGLESRAMRLAALVGQARQRVTANQVTDHEQGRALLEEALPLAQALQDREAEAMIMWLRVLLLMFGGDHEQQIASGERGLALARELGLKELEAFILHDMWYVYGGLGRWQEMNDALRQACVLWQALDNVPMLAASLTRMHYAQAAAGQYDQALQTFQEAYSLSVQGRDLESQTLSRALLGLIHLERGRPDLALAALDENLPLAESIGNVTVLSTGPAYKAWVYAMLGDSDKAVDLARQGVDYALSHFPLIAAMPQAILVRILLRQDDLDEAQQVFSQMEDYRTTRRRIGFFAVSWLMATIAAGEVALMQGEYERALAIGTEFVANAGNGNLHFLLPDAYLLRSRAQAALGQEKGARASLQEGLAQAEAQGSQRMLWPILAELAQMASAEGHEAQAQALRQRAADVLHVIARHINSETLRTSFLNQQTVRNLLDH